MKNSAMLDNTKLDCQIIILAAGNGSRMSSSLPKVMHQVDGKPMIERVLDNCASVSSDMVLVYSQMLLEHLTPYKHLCKFALQESPQGTAHAVDAAKRYFSPSKPIMVIYGDNPLITADIIQDLAGLFPTPIWGYQVSGEYQMIQSMPNATEIMIENLIAIKRSGAQNIICYSAEQIAGLL